MVLGNDVNAKVGAPDEPVQLIEPVRGISRVTVWLALKAEEILAVSCGKGTCVLHALADQFPPLVPLHVWVVGVVKVMPVFPPQSPDKPVAAERSTGVLAVMS